MEGLFAEFLREQAALNIKFIELVESQGVATVAVPEKGKKRKHRKKDPDVPKRTRSGYILFIEDAYEYMVEKMKKKHPDQKVAITQLAFAWQNWLTKAEKQQYNDFALTLKEERMQQIAANKAKTKNAAKGEEEEEDDDDDEEEEDDDDEEEEEDDSDDDSDDVDSPKHKKSKK